MCRAGQGCRQAGGEDDVVPVRVHAAGLHAGDCFAVHGSPFAVPLVAGPLKPERIPGSRSNETSDALRYIEGGHARGTVVVSLDGVTLNRSEHDATGGEVML